MPRFKWILFFRPEVRRVSVGDSGVWDLRMERMSDEQERVDSIEEKMVAMARAEAKVKSEGIKHSVRRALQFGSLKKKEK